MQNAVTVVGCAVHAGHLVGELVQLKTFQEQKTSNSDPSGTQVVVDAVAMVTVCSGLVCGARA